MLARIRRTILRRGMIARGDHVLVGCSGGPDSTALVHALARLGPELGFSVGVASVDHGLRPEAADEVRVVGAFAASLDLPFEPLSVVVPRDASVQAAARDARYAALLDAAARRGARRVAVGHTLDDQAETVLERLLRGAGLAGLGGIEPVRADGVVRPLIDVPRADVHAYSAKHELPVVFDPSNDDARFQRVRLRSNVLPALLAEDPNVARHLADVADEARETTTHLASEAQRFLGDPMPASLVLAELAALGPVARQVVVRTWASARVGRRLGRAHQVALNNLVLSDGHVLLPGGFAAIRRDGRLRIEQGLQRSTRSSRQGSEATGRRRARRHRP